MKKLLSIIMAVAVLVTALPSITVTVSADSLYIRKVVSIVCDDSGSMQGDKWAYANYALQVFCGMLNSEDQLYITYMSDIYEADDSGEIDTSLSTGIDLSTSDGIQDSIDSISTHKAGGGTPFKTVQTAYQKLVEASESDTNENTQYWLVVITDGNFDDFNTKSDSGKSDLDEYFAECATTEMANGTTPQIMFLSIGSKVTTPDEDEESGIYTYSAADADEIIDVMSEMADKISGRTRLESSDINQVDDYRIQVESSIPLLNIVCFVQGSDAKITGVDYNNETAIEISREADLSYPSYSGLVGSAYLIGDSQSAMGSGTYTITFDQEIDLDDVIILFEPALEVKMTVTLNGEEITDFKDLDNAMASDTVSAACKIYEMGTDTEISSSLLPSGTGFEITISEGGEIKATAGDEMAISDYILSNIETEVTATVTIDGFNPITTTVKFTPTEYVPIVVYSIVASFGSEISSVRHDDIADNEDLTICFTIYADDELITDAEAVSALNPTVTVSVDGNGGNTVISDDGTIIFTPTEASDGIDGAGSFDVDVTCTIDDGTDATQTYTVLLAEYEVVPVGTDETIRKTEFYGNQVGVSFYITKDGNRLDRDAVSSYTSSVSLNDEHGDLKTNLAIADDGTITVTPYSVEEHKLGFFSWWTNWAYYFGLSGKDVTVTLTHSLGTASSTIDVVGESASYLILNVILPLGLEILILALIIAYIVRYITKPRFATNGVLYVGSITRNRGTSGTHSMELREVQLKQFNKFGNLWNPFKELTVSANGVNVTAVKGNKISCNELFPWYADEIKPKARTITINSPKDVVNYCQEHDELVINEIKTTKVMDQQNRVISQDDSVYYFVRADIDYVKSGTKQIEVIDSAVAFCYSTIQN